VLSAIGLPVAQPYLRQTHSACEYAFLEYSQLASSGQFHPTSYYSGLANGKDHIYHKEMA